MLSKFYIPILVLIVLLLIGGMGYLGFNYYKNYQIQKSEKGKLAQENERLRLEKKQEVRQNAQNSELEKLKKEVESLKNLQNQSVQQQKSSPQNLSISASELTSYLSGVIELSCDDGLNGSGSLYPGNSVLTNAHVIEGQTWCIVHTTGENNIGDENYVIYIKDAKRWNDKADVAVVKISYIENRSCVNEIGNPVICPKITPIENLNYKIFNLPLCQIQIPIGSPIVVVGYPNFSSTSFDTYGIQGNQKTRTATNGIISGYHTNNAGNPLWKNFPYPNYFISAKIDSGSSGGIAFSKNENGLCILGIPTWLTIGNYETQGLVQNIHNILYKQ